MKYQSTTRLLNTILFATLFAGFLALAIVYGILITPYMVKGVGPVDLPSMSIGLSAMLAAIGCAGAVITGIGLVYSILSVVKGSDDNLVVKSFSCYIGLGYLATIGLLLNATWLYRLTTTNLGYNEVAFLIAVYSVFAIIIFIGSNVPLLKLYGEGEEGNKIFGLLGRIVFALSLGIALPFLLSFFVTLSAAGSRAHGSEIVLKLAFLAFIPLVSACLAFFSWRSAEKADKEGKENKLTVITNSGAVALLGILVILCGVFENVFESSKNHPLEICFVGAVKSAGVSANANWLDFSVMSYIIGGAILIAAIVFCVLSIMPSKKKTAK